MAGRDDRRADIELSLVPKPVHEDHSRGEPDPGEGMCHHPAAGDRLRSQAQRKCDVQRPVVAGVEPEIVFVTGERIPGPGVTAATALDAVESVHAGLEVIDSRFVDFRFTLPDVVADNVSSSRFLLSGMALPPKDLDLALEACALTVNGAVVDTATLTKRPGERRHAEP